MLKPEPKMMNICDCIGFLSISVWDQDWASQVAGISAVQPLVVWHHTAPSCLWWIAMFNSLVFQCDDMVSKCREMTSRSKPWFEVATQALLFPTEEFCFQRENNPLPPKVIDIFQVVLEYSFHDCSAMAPWSPARHIGSCFDSFAFTVLCCGKVSPGMKLPLNMCNA